ncbi:hypothetical protein LTR50_000936 [Elasticomyces elasticus]|nr:hypothetical protein LTR50_000936 [Elasticomyces elasticus]
MADYDYGGDVEQAELKKLAADVDASPDEFEVWEKLVAAVEGQEGGLTRNSSSQAITLARETYDRFLAKFPLFFGYWKKYADMEMKVAGTEAAEMVYERGVASITSSVDLWANYCAFKVETSHDSDVIRDLFERAANSVGLDFLAHPFWDKCLEFEERMDAHDKIFAILSRVIHIPMHQYARYFERYQQMSMQRPLSELAEPEDLARFRKEVEIAGPQGKSDFELERDLRTRIAASYHEIFQVTQTETTKRWTYEQEIKRPYFHVTELDDAQIANWRKYLDFEEHEGSYQRVAFLYERCLVTAARYEEFWLRYARWMLAQKDKQQEVRNIYERASCLHVPIAEPAIRLQYARFEEMSGRVDVAEAIHEEILSVLPSHIETLKSWGNLIRRQHGVDAAVAHYCNFIDSPDCDTPTKAALVVEWARLVWKVKGSAEEARAIMQKQQHWYLDSRPFWSAYLLFELDQPTGPATEAEHHQRIKAIHDEIQQKSRLHSSTIKELSHIYMEYLLERGTEDAAKEYMKLDQEVNGPASVSTIRKLKDEDKDMSANGQLAPLRYTG